MLNFPLYVHEKMMVYWVKLHPHYLFCCKYVMKILG